MGRILALSIHKSEVVYLTLTWMSHQHVESKQYHIGALDRADYCWKLQPTHLSGPDFVS